MKPAELFLGILTAVGGFVDVSELVFMSQAGSRFGYALIWVVILSTIGIMVFGEMSGRVAAIAKQPVFNLMRHPFPAPTGHVGARERQKLVQEVSGLEHQATHRAIRPVALVAVRAQM